MNKLQKFCLALSILLTINYALYSLFGFDLAYTFFHQKPWIEKLYAFLLGVSAFINLTLFQNSDE